MPQSPHSQMGSFIIVSMLVLVSVINIWDCSAETCASISEGSGKRLEKKKNKRELFASKK